MKTVEIVSPNANYNAFINGNFDFWQRQTTVTRTHGANGFTSDRVRMSLGPTASKSMTVQRSTTVPSGLVFPAQYSYEAINNTAFASFSGSDFINPFYSYIEGKIFQPLIGKPFTLGFWMFATSAIANYPVSFISSGSTFSYVTNISVAAGWGYYVVQVPWHSSLNVNTTGSAIQINLGMVSGPTYQAGSTGSWIAGAFYNTAASTNFYSIAGFTQRFVQMQLRSGYWVADQMKNTFQTYGANYGEELRACERYYEVTGIAGETALASGSQTGVGFVPWRTEKRAIPSVDVVANSTSNSMRNANTGATVTGLNLGPSVHGTEVRFSGAQADNVMFTGTVNADADSSLI